MSHSQTAYVLRFGKSSRPCSGGSGYHRANVDLQGTASIYLRCETSQLTSLGLVPLEVPVDKKHKHPKVETKDKKARELTTKEVFERILPPKALEKLKKIAKLGKE